VRRGAEKEGIVQTDFSVANESVGKGTDRGKERVPHCKDETARRRGKGRRGWGGGESSPCWILGHGGRQSMVRGKKRVRRVVTSLRVEGGEDEKGGGACSGRKWTVWNHGTRKNAGGGSLGIKERGGGTTVGEEKGK